MPDRETVIYDIGRCICHVPDACRDCSHYLNSGDPIGCMEDLLKDALVLLKEQEAEIRQLRLALDIAKGTCKGIKMEGR